MFDPSSLNCVFSIIIDGETVTAFNEFITSQTRSWYPGSEHSLISADEFFSSYYLFDYYSRLYVFSEWDNGGRELERTVTVPSSADEYEAYYDAYPWLVITASYAEPSDLGECTIEELNKYCQKTLSANTSFGMRTYVHPDAEYRLTATPNRNCTFDGWYYYDESQGGEVLLSEKSMLVLGGAGFGRAKDLRLYARFSAGSTAG